MRPIMLCAVFLFASTSILFGQQTTGFSDPDNIEPLSDYRLPDWGYSNFYIDFSTNATGVDGESGSFEQDRKNAAINMRPTFNLYQESEERIFQLNAISDFGYRSSSTNQSNPFLDSESMDKSLDIDLLVLPSIREYVSDRGFFYGEALSRIDYQSAKIENRDDGTLTSKIVRYDRTINFTPRLGFGFGRIRNVNPVIRAMRLKERVGELADDLSNQDILAAADQFTKYDGYQQTYDRPAKHFWSDMDESTDINLSSLNTFDMLYLTDVLDEAIGTRLEGWEVISGFQFDYSNQLERTEEPLINSPDMRNSDIRKEVGVFLDGRWYKNTSLSQQWGVVGNFEYNIPLGNDEVGGLNPQGRLMLTTGLNWLYNITDRILLRSSVINFHSREKIEAAGVGLQSSEFTRWTNQLSLDLTLNYFIENQLQLNASLRPSLMHVGNTENDEAFNGRTFRWTAGVGLRYYLSRNLY